MIRSVFILLAKAGFLLRRLWKHEGGLRFRSLMLNVLGDLLVETVWPSGNIAGFVHLNELIPSRTSTTHVRVVSLA
jgi:hypothetical protein